MTPRHPLQPDDKSTGRAGTSRSAISVRLIGLSLLLLLNAAGSHASHLLPQSPQGRHILLLYAYGYGGRGVELFSDGFFKAITEAGFPVINVYAEYLDLQRNRDIPGYRQEVLDVLKKKYAQRRIDLIVTVQQPALEFLLKEGGTIAPRAPVITVQNSQLSKVEKSDRRIIGEFNQFDIRGTLELALELFPGTERVLFASGSSEADIKISEQAARIAAPWKERLELEYTSGMTLDEILQRVSRLPPHSIIIFTQYNTDSKGRVALSYEAENLIIKTANAPVFGFYDYNLRNGGIGGSVIAVEASGVRTGRLALSVLNGKAPELTETLRTVENTPMFDWQQIRRWGGNPDRLPPHTEFINRTPTVWEEYGRIIAAALVLVLTQALLIAAMFVNIRRRRSFEARLRESEVRFRRLFYGVPLPMSLSTVEGKTLELNARFEKVFGYSQEDLPTAADWWRQACPDPDYRATAQENWHAAVARSASSGTDLDTIEYRVTCKDGSERIMLISGIILPEGLLATFLDVTGRRRAELLLHETQSAALEEQKRARLAALNQMEDANVACRSVEAALNKLRESESALRQAQHLAKAGNWSWDTIHDVHSWSEEIYLIYGRDPALPPAVYPEVAAYFTPESWSLLSAAVEKCLSSGTAYECDAEVVRSDGTHCWIIACGNADRDSSGKVVKLYGSVQDITERKRVEEEVLRLNANLEQRVTERTIQLEAANRELEAFSYTVSHDLRAPLRHIDGYVELLVSRCRDGLDEKGRHYVDTIAAAARQMGALIDDLLLFSRTGRAEMRRETLNMNQAVQVAMTFLQESNAGQTIEWIIADLPAVKGDFALIRQVWANLLENAVKYSKPRDVARIEVSARETDGEIIFTVADNGVGFDMKYVGKLFGVFQRLHSQEDFEGTGIGLATVQRIIFRHGGRVWAEAEPDHGATFYFTLPK